MYWTKVSKKEKYFASLFESYDVEQWLKRAFVLGFAFLFEVILVGLP